MINHLSQLASLITMLVENYLNTHEEADINDALSAICFVLVNISRQENVGSSDIMNNVGFMVSEIYDLNDRTVN